MVITEKKTTQTPRCYTDLSLGTGSIFGAACWAGMSPAEAMSIGLPRRSRNSRSSLKGTTWHNKTVLLYTYFHKSQHYYGKNFKPISFDLRLQSLPLFLRFNFVTTTLSCSFNELLNNLSMVGVS